MSGEQGDRICAAHFDDLLQVEDLKYKAPKESEDRQNNS